MRTLIIILTSVTILSCAGGDTGGTYIPPSGGGGTSGGGSGDGGSGYNPADNPDGGNTVVPIPGYIPPKPIVVIPEDEYVLDSKTKFLIDKWENNGRPNG